ncbi:MAG: nickel pincer cofactor biosynthesis protein LarC [Candidatus Bathyarchaeia archaeon]
MPTGSLTVIDCQASGISGDMFLSALLDLGADVKKINAAVERIGSQLEECGPLEMHVQDVVRCGFHAKAVEFKAGGNLKMTGLEALKTVKKLVKTLEVSQAAERFAYNAVKTLLEAEAKVHGRSFEEIHLHEAGEVDMLAEVLGSAAALDDLEMFDSKFYSTPVAVGGGLFTFSHGTLPSPAPATLEILRSKKFPLAGGPVEVELTTPTGASLLVNLVEETSRFYPPLIPVKAGYGAGAREIPGLVNVLRVVEGEPLDYGLSSDEVAVLETNVDDISGEVLGYTLERLLREGAKDVCLIPVYSKKNRPGNLIRVVADKLDVERLSTLLMRETGSLGARLTLCSRHVLTRGTVRLNVDVNGVKDVVKVKVARNRHGRIVKVKPEYEDVKKLAKKTGKPLREIMSITENEAWKMLKEH